MTSWSGASDGHAFSGWSTVHIDGPVNVNHAPTVFVPNQTVFAAHGQPLQMSDLISATDQDGDPITYSLVDSTPGGGHFLVNGVEQAANKVFDVTAAQLAQTTFVPAVGGSDDLMVRASDGHVFSDWSNLHIESAINHAPVLTVLNQAVDAGQTLHMSDLISATDPDGDALSYSLYDSTPGGGHFEVNGVEQAADQIVSVTAAQLAQTTFVSHVGDSDDLVVRASDGSLFSAWGHIHVEVASEHAPVVVVPNQTVDCGAWPNPADVRSDQRHGSRRRRFELFSL